MWFAKSAGRNRESTTDTHTHICCLFFHSKWLLFIEIETLTNSMRVLECDIYSRLECVHTWTLSVSDSRREEKEREKRIEHFFKEKKEYLCILFVNLLTIFSLFRSSFVVVVVVRIFFVINASHNRAAIVVDSENVFRTRWKKKSAERKVIILKSERSEQTEIV